MVRPLEELVDALCRLPTIGRKSAWRLALHLAERPEAELKHLGTCIADLRQRITMCRECFNYSETPVCEICSSANRDPQIICVVEKPTDVFAIERAGRFRGLYHVLGGLLSPINGITPDKLTIGALRERLERTHPREMILGLGGSGEAETTAQYMVRLFSSMSTKITRLARGVPAGVELEYIDQTTLSQALAERTDIVYGE